MGAAVQLRSFLVANSPSTGEKITKYQRNIHQTISDLWRAT
jgi:hypothetical protein